MNPRSPIISQAPRLHRPALLLLLAALAAAATGCGRRAATPADAEARAVPVQVRPAAMGTIERSVTVPGRVVGNQEALLTAKAPGRVSRVAVSLGDFVRKGDVLVSLETEDMARQVEQARAAYDTARANIERMRLLFEEGAISRQQWEQADLQETQAAVALDLARSALSNATIAAPFDGYVTSLMIETGEMASPGVPLLTVIDTSRLFLEGGVADTHAALIAKGQDVRVETEALPGRSFAGKVEAVSPAADSQRRTFPVRIALPEPPPGLRAGMFARAVAALERREGAVLVPLDAVLGQGADRHLYVVDGGVAHHRKVEVGLDDGVNVEVRSGLREGESVVVAGQQYLRDGAPVRAMGGAGK